MNIVVFDVETKELAPRGDPTERELGAIGISVACAFDYLTGEYSAYMQDNLGALWYRLTRADLVVGFNIRRFDVPVLFWPLYESLGTGGEAPEIVDQFEETKALVLSKCYDIYEESKLGARAGKYDKGFKADDHLRAIWGHPAAKTGTGLDAPRLFREGKMGELTSYCLADVHRERRLFERCWNRGALKSMGDMVQGPQGPLEFPVLRPQLRLDLPVSTELPWLIDSPSLASADIDPPPPHAPAPQVEGLASDAI